MIETCISQLQLYFVYYAFYELKYCVSSVKNVLGNACIIWYILELEDEESPPKKSDDIKMMDEERWSGKENP